MRWSESGSFSSQAVLGLRTARRRQQIARFLIWAEDTQVAVGEPGVLVVHVSVLSCS